MWKTKKIICSIIISLFIASLIVASIYYAYKSSGQNPNLYTIISGWVSCFATLIIGFLTIWLTYKIDMVSKKNEELRNNEQKQQYINQLKLTANPIIYFENIEMMSYSRNTINISNNEYVNRLLDKNPNTNHIQASSGLFFDIVFKTPKAENVENIYIESINFSIKKQDNFGIIYNHSFINNSKNKKANLKYKENGSLICHTDLLLIEDDSEFFNYLESVVGKNNQIVLMTELVASNSLGVYKKYSCAFYYNIISKEITERNIINYEIKNVDNVMWVDSVSVNKI